jgi:predicted aconitase with swiveling domain
VTRISGRALRGRALVTGAAGGPAVVLAEPLSFWGGFDPSSGRVVDERHPQAGTVLSGQVLLMPSGRGSSSSSSVLAEAIRAGTAPVATVLAHRDEILALGALVARELYGLTHPVVVLDEGDYSSIASGDVLEVAAHDQSAVVIVVET